MSTPGSSRAAELAAQQVETIVQAAEVAAEKIRERGQREAEQELEASRRKAEELERKARGQAKAVVEEAEKESERLQEQTRAAVEGRVAAAEKAAAEVLEEARALSGGLRRLGETLGDQAERILRDVQAAHRRMQADLRVAPVSSEEPRPRRAEGSSGSAAPDERERIIAAAEAARAEARPETGRERRSGRSARRNPLEDLEVPTWIGRER